MEKSNVQKPMIIAMEEAEPILVNAVNQILESGVSPYFAEMVFEKVHKQLRDLANSEMQNARTQYAIALQEAEKSAENADLEENVANPTKN
jgi:hypothetical protein